MSAKNFKRVQYRDPELSIDVILVFILLKINLRSVYLKSKSIHRLSCDYTFNPECPILEERHGPNNIGKSSHHLDILVLLVDHTSVLFFIWREGKGWDLKKLRPRGVGRVDLKEPCL